MRHPQRGPELGEPVERTIGRRLVLAPECGVPVLDLRGDLHDPALAHRSSIAPTLYRIHAIANICACGMSLTVTAVAVFPRQAVKRVVDRMPEPPTACSSRSPGNLPGRRLPQAD